MLNWKTLKKLGDAVLFSKVLGSYKTRDQIKNRLDSTRELFKRYVGRVYEDTLPSVSEVEAKEGDMCILIVNDEYIPYEVVSGEWKKYTTKEGATTGADLTDYYTKPEVRGYVDNLIKDFIPKNGDNTFSGSNTFTKPIVGDLSGNADTATKATQDSEGNVIKDTYVTKTECESKASLDATQMLAVNSGITASKVAEYEAMKTSKVNEADIKPVAKTGSYSDLINKPTINDSNINIKVNGVSIGTFTTNSADAKDIAITVPTKMSDLDNDSDYVASTTLHDYAKLTEVENKISELVNSAPETLDTLNGLASALGNDPNFATTIAYQIGTKANKDNVYTKSETDTLLGGKLDTTHNHDTAYLGISAKAESAKSADSVAWDNVSGKPSSFTPSSHTHDDRYYTESEVDTKLSGKQNALSSQQIANINDVTNKANDSDVVHKSGDTMTGDLLGNGSNNLGTSTNKWKTLNGINPGALSLPSTTGKINISISPGESTYTPPANGWLQVVSSCLNFTLSNSLGMGLRFYYSPLPSVTFHYFGGFIPCLKGEACTIYVDTATTGYFIPCQGNV